MKCIFRFLVLLTLFANSAYATDTTIFGIDLGKPLSLPECRKETKYGMTQYEFLPETMCFQFEKYIPIGYKQNVKTVQFPSKVAPEIMMGDKLTLLEIDGNVEGLEFNTRGIMTQDGVIAALVEKFGKPTKFVNEKVQNKMGAVYDSIYSKWVKKNLTIEFYGTFLRLTDGRVYIDTDKAANLRKKWLQEETAQKTKL